MYLAILCLHRYRGLQQREEECTGIFANTRTVERTLSHLQHFVCLRLWARSRNVTQDGACSSKNPWVVGALVRRIRIESSCQRLIYLVP